MRANPFALTVLLLLSVNRGFGGTVDHVGSGATWTTTWQPLPSGVGEIDNGVTEVFDFVGDSTSPGLYWANSDDYIFFRMRVDADTFTTASGAHLLLIDIVGSANTIDYGFAWDSKSNDVTAHGLEMQVPATNGPTWGGSQMNDIDAPSQNSKLVNDINGFDGGVQRTTDGYVQSSDGQSTTNFGNTTFIDFAVSWSYLTTYTGLTKNQEWKIAVGSLDNKTDHNAISTDISGGANLTDSISNTGWSNPISVPEPRSALMFSLAGLLVLFQRRRPSPHP